VIALLIVTGVLGLALVAYVVGLVIQDQAQRRRSAYIIGYAHGWEGAKAGRQYGEGHEKDLSAEAAGFAPAHRKR